MAHNNVEIEIQARVEKIKPLLAFLKKRGKFVGKKRQVDEYFSPIDKKRDFLRVRPVDEWLRLRDADGKLSINYKYWHHDKSGRSYYSDEYETEIGSIEQGEKILRALKFRPIAVVDKVREIWNYKDYEIAIDRVKGLGRRPDAVQRTLSGKEGRTPGLCPAGDFVEIEYMSSAKPRKATLRGKSASAKKIGNEMIKFLKDLGCGKLELSWQGYPFQLLFPKEVKYERIE